MKLALALAAALASVPLAQPFKVAAGPGGTLLVADAGTQRVVRVAPSTRRTVVMARLPRTAAVCTGAGKTYAIADEKLWQLGSSGPELVWTSTGEGPTDCAVTRDGSVYVSRYGDHVDRIEDGEAVSVASGFDRPHGIEAAPDGSMVVADSYAGAVRRIARDGTVSTIASHLGRPMDVAIAGDGSLRVADILGKRLLRIRGGRVAVVAKNLGDVTGVAIVRGSTYVVAVTGRFRLAKVGENGSVTRLA